MPNSDGSGITPIWFAVLGSLAVIGIVAPAITGIGAIAALAVGRKRHWVVAVSVVLLVWVAVQVTFSGRILPGI